MKILFRNSYLYTNIAINMSNKYIISINAIFNIFSYELVYFPGNFSCYLLLLIITRSHIISYKVL